MIMAVAACVATAAFGVSKGEYQKEAVTPSSITKDWS